MPSIKLDGKEIPFEQGETIIKAASRQGLEIPHYCWHPGLSIAANCRMCLVEIEPMANRRQIMLDVLNWDSTKQDYAPARKPKLEPACQVECVDGMVIQSEHSRHVSEARKHVQESLLLNHPVDCPICDQAGECKLQDYWLSEQRTPKRMHDEPVHKPKAVSFGPTIVYDAERCIVCTRCVRFMEEVAKDPVLDKRERGNLSEIVLSPGRQLEGHYTMMVDEVCPVGALTTKDFRFKARVWFLRKEKTICPGCATGCNAWLEYDSRTGEVPRMRPRENLQVNRYWMCDDGILTHRRVQEKRVLQASVGRGTNRKIVTPLTALKTAAEILRAHSKVAVVLSAQRSTEDNFAFAYFAKTFLNAKDFYLARLDDWDGDDILRSGDHNPNTRGAILSAIINGVEIKATEQLVESVVSGQITTVLALGGLADFDEVMFGSLGRAKLIVFADQEGPLTSLADALLPAASWAEQTGSFINRNNLEQRFEQGPPPKGDSLPGWQIVTKLARETGHTIPWSEFRELRAMFKTLANQQASFDAIQTASAE